MLKMRHALKYSSHLDIKRRVLKTGMTVIFKERKNKVVSVAFAVRFGGINEKIFSWFR